MDEGGKQRGRGASAQRGAETECDRDIVSYHKQTLDDDLNA